MPTRAALFDMDRTLVRIDTATLYVRYQRATGQATWRDALRVAWWMLQYTAGVIDAPAVAEKALRSFRGKEESWLAQTCEQWFPEYVLEHVCAQGREAVRRHREAGDHVAIVTGATPYAARPLARELGIDHVVCTELELDGGCFTGQVVPPLGYGHGKVTLAERLAERLGFSLEDSVFYTDSITDLPLLERVRERVIVNPDARLRRLARERGWPVEQW
jgi:HAD superfamily hydrolase (TIGR01490 family)